MTATPPMAKLAIIAGGGEIPKKLAAACERQNRPYAMVALEGCADADLAASAGIRAGMGQAGKVLDFLRKEACREVVMVGRVTRPDFQNIKLDWRGARLLPKVAAAARRGDDALLRVLLDTFEKEGYRVVGADDVMGALVAGRGQMGRIAPTAENLVDIEKARAIARALGAYDVGQGAVVCRGLVLAVEAAEGTDAMLERCARLPESLRGRPGALAGVLVKALKPIQERRLDLPTIGIATVEGAARAGLAGIAVEAGACIVADPEEVTAAADRLGVFVLALEEDNPGAKGPQPA